MAYDPFQDLINARGHCELAQNRLIVDYYRIRRKVAYPLAAESMLLPELDVPGVPIYPWATWMSWRLEDRLHGLANSLANPDKHRSPDAQQMAACLHRELLALSRWPRYDQYDKLDLSFGHLTRLMGVALRQFPELPEPLQQALHAACHRAVDGMLVNSDESHGQHLDADAILEHNEPHKHLHNIPTIGATGLAIAAMACDHPRADELNRRACILHLAILSLRDRGHTEGLAYDGYLADFAVDLLQAMTDHQRGLPLRDELLNHANWDSLLNQSTALGAPGNVPNVAQIGDVEPREMPFHASTHAKLLRLKYRPESAWLLRQWIPSLPHLRLWIRNDAIGALLHPRREPQDQPLVQPDSPAGHLDAHYVQVLRTGWEHNDVAVVVSCTTSQMDHLHRDAGHLCVGLVGDWAISDPGYQQYMATSERQFTLEPAAHNCPTFLTDGEHRGQTQRQPRLISAGPDPDAQARTDTDCWQVTLELKDCYDQQAINSLTRQVRLHGRRRVEVIDRFDLPEPRTVGWHWLGATDAGWWVDADGSAVLAGTSDLGDQAWSVRISTDTGGPIAMSQIDRRRGSRGQMTLARLADLPEGVSQVRWVFEIEMAVQGG